jgi:mannose-6-phosphate isomerase-like protein (cupin superfamily)
VTARRRVVVAQGRDGASVVHSDETLPEVVLAPSGGELTVLWGDDDPPRLPASVSTVLPGTFLPPPRGWRAAILTFPPAGHPAPPDRAGTVLPDLAERMRSGGGRGMHATPTVDVVHVLAGELVMELDHGQTVRLGTGDTVVQNGTRHGWRNPGAVPATLILLVVGATEATP